MNHVRKAPIWVPVVSNHWGALQRFHYGELQGTFFISRHGHRHACLIHAHTVEAHVLRLRVAECEEALGLPAEKIVIAYLVMQAQSAEVVGMLPKRAFIKSRLDVHAWLPKEWISVYTNCQ